MATGLPPVKVVNQLIVPAEAEAPKTTIPGPQRLPENPVTLGEPIVAVTPTLALEILQL